MQDKGSLFLFKTEVGGHRKKKTGSKDVDIHTSKSNCRRIANVLESLKVCSSDIPPKSVDLDLSRKIVATTWPELISTTCCCSNLFGNNTSNRIRIKTINSTTNNQGHTQRGGEFEPLPPETFV